MKKYFGKTTPLSVLSLLVVIFLRDSVVLTLISLTTIILFFLHFSKNKNKDFVIFCFGFFLGPIAEFLVINSGAWTYSSESILYFNFSYYLPFIWGIACLAIKNFTFRIYKITD